MNKKLETANTEGASGTLAWISSPMRRMADVSSRIVERYLPDAFIFVFLLTGLVFVLGLFKGEGPVTVLGYWGEGFFSILAFTTQSVLMMITGFALAHTPAMNRALTAFARIPRNEVQVIIVTTLVMMVCSWLSWGFGLIAGGIVAREMGIVHRGKIHYPLVVAASYAGFLVWHAGYGGAIPTLIATPGHFLESEMGLVPVSETIFAPSTLLMVLALAVVVPLALIMMRPAPGERRKSFPENLKADEAPEPDAVDKRELSPAERLERSRFVPLCLGALGILWLISYFAGGGGLNINVVIMSFFAVGLALTPSARDYINYFSGGAKAAYGIILQFPFYAGIMGMMIHTGIAADIAGGLVRIADADTLPFWGFISAGIVNMFVPAGGGQWTVQGPIMVAAAQEMGANMADTAMSVAWGDAWTNMIQPFWTLPLLAIAGLGIRDIMGYTAVILVISGVVIGGGLLLF
jgi:short-chain fatty acids transporter